MAHSFVDYKEKSIHTKDTLIEVVVVLLCKQIDKDADLEKLFEPVVKEWKHQRSWAFGGGCVDLKLDYFLEGNPTREQKLVDLLKSCHSQITMCGESIHKDVMNKWMGWNDDTPDRFVKAQPTKPITHLIDKMLELFNLPENMNQ